LKKQTFEITPNARTRLRLRGSITVSEKKYFKIQTDFLGNVSTLVGLAQVLCDGHERCSLVPFFPAVFRLHILKSAQPQSIFSGKPAKFTALLYK
jgi:hypothetical protein